MSLHVSPDLIERFPDFYPFALGGNVPEEPALIVENVDDDTLANAVRGRLDAVCVIVRDSLQLRTLCLLYTSDAADE